MASKKTTAAKPKGSTESFDYDAAVTTNRRKAPRTKLAAEHIILPQAKRKKVTATVQDQVRNVSVAAWAVRRHLDYVSKFRFQFRTGNEALDKLVNRLFDWHARPRNFDIAERFGREEMFRMFESEKVTAGDAAIAKLANGKMQAIESDLIALPTDGRWNKTNGRYDPVPKKVARSVNKDTGVVMDPKAPGRVAEYCICNRGDTGKGLAFDHLESARNVIFDAYYTRFSSQVRGVSPLTTAINSIQDLYEGVDWNLAKAKAHALFGIAIMRDYATAGSDQEEIDELGAVAGITTGADENKTGASESEGGTKSVSSSLQQYQPDQMMLLDMETRGRVDTIESKNPSSEFQAFTELVLRLVFLALDIPFTAFNSRASNFSGLIADQNMYDVSCKWKREKNGWKRQEYSDWLIERAWDDPEWQLREAANAAGISRLREVQAEAKWVPSGSPWLQKLQEVQGDIKAISVGLDNPIDACKRRGTDFFENIRKTADAYRFAEEHDVPLMIGEPGQATVEESEGKSNETEGDGNEQD